MSGGGTNSTFIGDEGVIATIGGVPSTGANVPPDVGVLDEPDTDAMPLVRPSEPDVGTVLLGPNTYVMFYVSSYSGPMMSMPWIVTIKNSTWNSSAPVASDPSAVL